jgi:hypothetical protein
LRLVSDEPGAVGEQWLVSRLRAVTAAEDEQPPAECRACRAGLGGAEAVEPRWAQVIDAEIVRKVTGCLLSGLACPCCGAVTFAEPLPGLHAGSVSYGPVLNAAAVLLTASVCPAQKIPAEEPHARRFLARARAVCIPRCSGRW